MGRRGAVAAVCLGLAIGGCASDTKGEICGFGSLLVDGDGTPYCPDDEAPKACNTLFDAMLDKLVVCANQQGAMLTKEQLKAQVTLPCDKAKATSKKFDECLTQIKALSCPPSDLPTLPEICRGVVLTTEK